jgi:hypothetical protein
MFDWILLGAVYAIFVVLLAARHLLEDFAERNAGTGSG